VEFNSVGEAQAAITRWVKFYNYQRTHQELGGCLVLADRFHGREKGVIRSIAEKLDPDGTNCYGIVGIFHSLFNVMLEADGKIGIYLFGQVITHLGGKDERNFEKGKRTVGISRLKKSIMHPNRYIHIKILLPLLLSLWTISCSSKSIDMDQRTEELKNLRFGMFICWSFSTFSGKEWTQRIKDVSFFRATNADTDQWARTAREAGMGYILFLTKHHDGFCLWNTETTDRKVTNAPLGRDVLAEIRTSCDKYGIKLALYFSESDWTWPEPEDGEPGFSGVNPTVKKAQLKELLTQYGPIEWIWFDHAIGDGGLSHKETAAFVKSLQPGCFVGFNHGDQAIADIRIGEMGVAGSLDDHQAAGPHMKDPPGENYRLAEFAYPILPPHEGGATWFYSLPRHDKLCHPTVKIYTDYLDAVKYDNIFSLAVAPDYTGRLRGIDVETLREVGEMIRDLSTPQQTKNVVMPCPGTQK